MGTKYSTNSSSGYNATPPADDGTVSEANKVKWSTVKTKLSDPVKDLADTINSELVTHFNNGPTAITSNTTLDATHYNQVIQVSGSGVTLTLTDANTLGAGWYCDIVSTDASNNVTLARATASNMINETSADVTILPLQALHVVVNAAANGFLVGLNVRHSKPFRMSGASIVETEGAAVASAATTNIWATDGNTVHITGTTTITSLGTAPQVGAWMKIVFDDALTLTHAADLNLPSGANIITAAGDFAFVYADTTTQLDVLYFRANGTAVIGPPATQAEMEAASSITTMVTPGRTKYHPGVAKAWITLNGTGTIAIVESLNVGSVTDNGTGDYTVTFSTAFATAGYPVVTSAKRDEAGTEANLFANPRSEASAAGSKRILTLDRAGSAIDAIALHAAFFGDQ